LLVEDEDLVRQVTRRILEGNGYTVLGAKDGHEALEILEQCQNPVHLVLTDMVMPGLTGMDLAARLASQCPEIKVLFMSGYAEHTIMDRDPTAQGLAYLQKPFTAHALTQKVRELLDASPTPAAAAASPETQPHPLPTKG
jgi:CheY-like chemotaxis protein